MGLDWTPIRAARDKLIRVICPKCSRRPAKRSCPALGTRICPTCCATKRLVEIRCPTDCTFLAAAHQHPAAIVRRQREHDLLTLVAVMGIRPSELQLQLFFLLGSRITSFRPDGIASLSDADVADAAGAMATTLEAAAGGLIAEAAGTSPNSEGLRRQLDALLAEVGKGAGSGFAREAAAVLRGIERGARHESPGFEDSEFAYLTLLGRVVPPMPGERPEEPPSPIVLA